MKAPIQQCQQCRHFVLNPFTLHAHCQRGQKLSFTFPKTPGFQDPKSWGWRRRCNLFEQPQQTQAQQP